jgi:hypothetical protein
VTTEMTTMRVVEMMSKLKRSDLLTPIEVSADKFLKNQPPGR